MLMKVQASDLEIVGLSKRYHSVVAVENLSLRINKGEMLALLGPSGCGKTTTLRMIAGLVQPTAGEIKIEGRSITSVPVHRRNLGMLFQNYALFPHLTVEQNVRFGLEMRGVNKHEAARRVEQALSLVRLGGFGDRLSSALSGGQQQRVALARALVIEPSVLLLDEPLSALDKSLRESVQVELRQLQQRLGITAVIVTHDQEEALTMADQIAVMRNGVLEQIGTPTEIYGKPVSRFVASFIGASNFMQARLVQKSGASALYETEGGVQLTIATPGKPEDAVLVALRPEAITLVPEAENGYVTPNQTMATVEQVIYRGSFTHLELRMDDNTKLMVHHQNRPGAAALPEHAPGRRVKACWPEASNHIVAAR